MAIKIEMLRVFSYVAQTGNLVDAARRLGRTQSAVSMTLKQLEEHLGHKLFEGERKTRLTPLGDQIFVLAQQQVRHFDATIREIETSASSPSGLLRIASIPSAAGLLIPTAVHKLMARHSGLKIDVRDSDTAMVVDALVHGQADIGIASTAPSLNGIHATLLFRDPFGLTCAPQHHLARQRDQITINDLKVPGFIGNNLCQQIEHESVQRALASTNIHAHNMFSLIGMIQTCNWFTILPRTVVNDLPGNLAFMPIEGIEASRSVSALISERSSQRSIAEEFVRIMEDLV